jgi:hypothetical protein
MMKLNPLRMIWLSSLTKQVIKYIKIILLSKVP